MQDIQIEIPVAVMGQVQNNRMVPAAYLALLAQLTGRPELPSSGKSEILYDPFGEPSERIETFGDAQYGLEMRATPIASGQGVHGEAGTWHFWGLPDGIVLRGYHYLDMRGSPYNEIRLSFQSQDPALAAQIESHFGRAIMTVIAYDRAH
jgi:hypothetical protein